MGKACFLVVISIIFGVNCERLSRQITERNLLPYEINNWIPLTPSCPTCQQEDRSKNARLLNYPQNQMVHNLFNGDIQESPQLYPVAPPRKFSQFGMPVNKQSEPSYFQRYPTPQSFFQFEMPAYQADGNRQHDLPSVHTGYEIHHSGNQRIITPSLFSQKPPFPVNFQPSFLPQQQMQIQQKGMQQNFVENVVKLSKDINAEANTIKQNETLNPARLSLNQEQFQNQNGVHTFQTYFPFEHQPTFQARTAPKEEEVQLLYIPYDTLYEQKNLHLNENKYNIASPTISPKQISIYSSAIVNKAPMTITSTARPISTYHPLLHPTFTTPKLKLKPHQPPLAIFMMGSSYQTNEQAVKEILAMLQTDKSIAVMDTPSIAIAPPVFIGPARLPQPSSYIKLDLPYLSSIEPIDIDRHPFYVAPASYKAPLEFTKIALPKPHVGSLIINRNFNDVENDTVQHLMQRPHEESKPMYITSFEDTQPQNIAISTVTSQPAKQSNSLEYTRTTNQKYYQPEQTTSPQRQISTDKYQFQVKTEQITPNLSFKPVINTIVNEEYFTAVTPLTGSTSSTTASEFNENYSVNSNAEVEINPSISTYLAPHEIENAAIQSKTQRTDPNTFNQQAIQNKDEFKMKKHFREQQDLKSRQKVVVENIGNTQGSASYENNAYNIPTSTPSNFDDSHLKLDHRHKFIFDTPLDLQTHKESNGVPFTSESKTSTTPPFIAAVNHRPSYNDNISTYKYNVKSQEVDHNVEFDPNPYQLPSELPPLTSNLPGLVNALIEAEKLNANKITTFTTSERSFRRPITHRRHPSGAKTLSYGNDTTTRHPIIRSRGHYNPRILNPFVTTAVPSSETSKIPVIRNPNKIRYKPTLEERQYFRHKISQSSNINSRKSPKAEDNIEYQRDILNQNYPVFNASDKTSTSTMPTTIIPTEPQKKIHQEASSSLSEGNKDEINTFAALLEPMQISQEYQQISKDNFGPGYFPKEELSEAKPSEDRNPDHPIYTTPAVHQIVRQRPHIRRTARPVKVATDATPSTTSGDNKRYTVRSRILSEHRERHRTVANNVRTHKVDPYPKSTSVPDKVASETSSQKVNRFNQDFYDNVHQEENKNNNHHRKFNFDVQESQWSSSLLPSNGFRPIEPDHKAKFLREFDIFEDEPEIVTAGLLSENDENNKDSFLFNVTALIGPSFANNSKLPSAERQISDNSTNTFFTNISKKIMSDNVEDGEKTEEKSMQAGIKTRRKGVWKRVRIHQSDAVETAESQNVVYLHNSIQNRNTEKANELKPTKYAGETMNSGGDNISAEATTVATVNNSQVDTNFSTYNNSTVEPASVALTTDHIEKIATEMSPIQLSNVLVATSSSEIEISTVAHESYDRGTELVTEEAEKDEIQDYANGDLETQPSFFLEVQRQLGTVSAIKPTDNLITHLQPHQQKYTTIQRNRSQISKTAYHKKPEVFSYTTEVPPFRENLKNSVIYATSTSREITHETEICYRGKCVKSDN